MATRPQPIRTNYLQQAQQRKQDLQRVGKSTQNLIKAGGEYMDMRKDANHINTLIKEMSDRYGKGFKVPPGATVEDVESMVFNYVSADDYGKMLQEQNPDFTPIPPMWGRLSKAEKTNTANDKQLKEMKENVKLGKKKDLANYSLRRCELG